MNEYIIKQRINTSSIPPTVYEEDKKGKNSCVCIASKDGKYGMTTEEGKPFLPFEYDNISMAGFSLYLLIQNGKMGLLHAKRPTLYDDQPFEIIKLIPCEYDMITFPKGGDSFVLLRKDGEKTSSIQIYFTQTGKISEPRWRDEYIDRDYILVTDIDHRTEKIFYKNGDFIYSDTHPEKPVLFCAVYETFYGTVFVKVKEDDSVSLVFAEKKKRADCKNRPDDDYYYELTGVIKEVSFDHFVRPILASEHIRTFERDFALGFVVEHEDEYQLLDGKCHRLSNDDLSNLSICTSVRSKTGQGTYTEITLNKNDIFLEEFENEYAKGFISFCVDDKE